MGKYRKKPVVVEANQWFKNGDHPDDNTFAVTAPNGFDYPSEGKVVRYFRRPDVVGQRACELAVEPCTITGGLTHLKAATLSALVIGLLKGVMESFTPANQTFSTKPTSQHERTPRTSRAV